MGPEARGEPQDRHIVEISRLLDLMEEQVRTGMRVPLTNRVAVDEDEFLAMLDQLRATIPAEVRQARRVIQDRQDVILLAQKDAERIISQAKERADYLTSSQGVMAEARQRSEEMLRQSRLKSQQSVDEVEHYALRVIGEVESTMRECLKEIENVRRSVDGSRPPSPVEHG